MTALEMELEALRKGQTPEDTTASPSVKEMNELLERIAELRDRETEAADVKKKITAELEATETRLVEQLLENNLTSYRCPAGLASLSFRTSVKTPKTPEQKKAFFDYLKSIGRYDELVSVNSQSLNSFYKEQLELAKEEGKEDVEIPGLTEVSINPNLSFRRSR